MVQDLIHPQYVLNETCFVLGAPRVTAASGVPLKALLAAVAQAAKWRKALELLEAWGGDGVGWGVPGRTGGVQLLEVWWNWVGWGIGGGVLELGRRLDWGRGGLVRGFLVGGGEGAGGVLGGWW